IRVFHVTGVQTCALPIYTDALEHHRYTIPDAHAVTPAAVRLWGPVWTLDAPDTSRRPRPHLRQPGAQILLTTVPHSPAGETPWTPPPQYRAPGRYRLLRQTG